MSRVTFFAAAGVLALLAPPAYAADDDGGGKDLAEVVVTAAPYVVSIDSTTTSVNVVKREDLDLAPSAGLGDVLANLPGVRSSFFGPGASRPVIRGLSGPRVQVLTNGVGMIDASGLSPDHQVASDPQEAERIEVLRGPSALAYGGSAIGGIVNIIDNRIPSTYREGVHGRALASYSTGDEGKAVSGALSAGFGGGFTVTLDGAHRRSGDYEIPVDPMSRDLAAELGLPAPSRARTKVPNTFVDLDAVGGGLSYVGEQGWGGVAIKHTDSSYGSAAEEDVHIGLKQTRIDTRGGLNFGFGPFESIKFAGGYSDYKHTEFEGDEPGTTFLSKGYEGRVELVQPNRDGWQGAVGFQGLHRTFDAIGDEALIPATKIDELGVFTLQRLDKDSWGVEGGVRVDTRSVKNIRADRDFTNLSASLGVFARPLEGWFFGASVSRTSRALTEEELSSFGAHPATGAFEVGDPTLDKEVSYSLDTTAHYSNDTWTLDLHGFYADYDNFIDLVPTGATDPDSGFPIFNFVQGGAKFYGTEAEVGYTAWRSGDKSFRLEATGDYVHGTTDSGPAVRIPPWSLTGRGVYTSGFWTGTVELHTVGKQTRVANFELPTDGYTMLDVSLVVRPFENTPDLKVFVDAHNLTNVEAREAASFLKDVAPLPGRSFRMGVGYRF
ncbi:MAG: TonB-dependent receptor [Alphaproteobacteria bacterium]|nr:TonB-dependent receptor [Alphaproteobacteria bacterium]MBU1515437.1 TonB-dependent receptor [Alphaproteobacteria bacterium]MBU2095435.1 TonB-dependent receptor [Alphaproteobacteria bacterium]MBU2150677.1 TonB-dependent receptor [Alphaproteobacteria bacterium]MBU2306941.1 TonB-dependent receptor [Alphaproteobacteria bacterium]